MTDSERIFLSPPHMSGNEFKYLKDAFDSNWIAPVGPYLPRFESMICEYTGAKAAVAVSSGTAAIDLVLEILNIRSGDTIICSDLTFIGSISAAVHRGAKPVFVDSAPGSWNMDPAKLRNTLVDLEQKGTPPKAVIFVNLYGYPDQIEEVIAVCKEFDLPIIEDAAESLGSTYKGQHSGTFGDFGIFSFNGNKIITTSGGGMLIAKQEKHVEQARHLATQARQPVAHYEHTDIGFNYRLSNLLAAIGCAQLEALEQKIERKKDIHNYYRDKLQGFVEFMEIGPETRPNFWLNAGLLSTPKDVGELVQSFESLNIECRRVWKPMHLQPACQRWQHDGGEVAASYFQRGVCLPSGSSLKDEEIERIAQKLIEHLS